MKKGLVKSPLDYPMDSGKPSPGIFDGEPGYAGRTAGHDGPPEKTYDTPPGGPGKKGIISGPGAGLGPKK